ncbi:unnamed protein product [Agarophyton chilense]
MSAINGSDFLSIPYYIYSLRKSASSAAANSAVSELLSLSICHIASTIFYSFHIPPQYELRTRIRQNFLGWEESSSKAVYIELRARTETYGLVPKKVEFENF